MESTRVTQFSSGKTVVDTTKKGYGCLGTFRLICCIILSIICCPFTVVRKYTTVKEYERLVVFRLGRIRSKGPKLPGLRCMLLLSDKGKKIDLRTKTFDIERQTLLTNDSVEISVDAVCNMKIVDPIKVVMSLHGDPTTYHLHCKELAATCLRNTLGTKTLDEVLGDRDGLAQHMQVTLDNVTEAWGIKIERVEIKDVKLPDSMRRSMASVAEAERDGTAQIVAAEGELRASEALKQAGDVMALNPSTMQLRYLQTLNQVGADKNKTYLFPLPTELLEYLKRK